MKRDKENNELERYKYNTIVMIIIYIIIMSVDLIGNTLSNQAIMISSIFVSRQLDCILRET